MYTVETETFEGPLDLLLQLIEKEKLNICQISLSKITDSYLNFLSKMNGTGEEMADFLVIAAKLLYIKSKQLLPDAETEEEEAEIADLEERLMEYQKFKAAAKELENILAEGNRAYRRRAKNNIPINFLPPNNLDNSKLFAIFQEILNKTTSKDTEETIIETEKITIEERREDVRNIIKNRKKVSFREVLGGVKTRTGVILTFLAILEMIKQKEILFKQDKNFADFTIEKV